MIVFIIGGVCIGLFILLYMVSNAFIIGHGQGEFENQQIPCPVLSYSQVGIFSVTSGETSTAMVVDQSNTGGGSGYFTTLDASGNVENENIGVRC